jgi:hypothetical protein
VCGLLTKPRRKAALEVRELHGWYQGRAVRGNPACADFAYVASLLEDRDRCRPRWYDVQFEGHAAASTSAGIAVIVDGGVTLANRHTLLFTQAFGLVAFDRSSLGRLEWSR